MEVYVKFIICIIFASAAAITRYRDDYEYNNKTDAFYKLHDTKSANKRARDICTAEGAKLISPTTKEDIEQLNVMLNNSPENRDVVWVDMTNQTSCDVITRNGIETIPCTQKNPFICKVEGKDVPFDPLCGVYASGYQYMPSIGSCYKVPPFPYTWNAANAECLAEGAHLVVLNSEAERQEVHKLLLPIDSLYQSFYVGIRAIRHTRNSTRVFRTVYNETLDKAGYNVWSPNQPDNYNDSQDCVVIHRSTDKYNDVNCFGWFRFICENEAHTEVLQESPY